MVTLSLCMVLENDSSKIPKCLESILHIVDEIVIVMIGENDNIKKICTDYTSKIYILNSVQEKGDAWNYCFTKASMDYIIWLEDGDYLLEGDAEKLRKLKEDIDHSVETVKMAHYFICNEKTYSFHCFRNRIVKQSGSARWQQGLNCFLPVKGKVIESDIIISHHFDKNEHILRLSLFEELLENGEKMTARELFFYAQKLNENKNLDSALKYYSLFLREKGGWAGDKLLALDKIADIYRIKKDTENEINYILKSFEYDLPRAEFACRLGMIFTERNELDKAIYWYHFAASLDSPEDNLGFVKEECWSWEPHLKLCGCYYKKGNFEKAYKHNELALGFSPDNKVFLHNKAVLEDQIKKKLELTQGLVANEKQQVTAKKTFKIVQVAPDFYPVPPNDYGGIEIVIYELCEALVRLGHEVFLFAPEGSRTSAKLIPYRLKTKGDFNQIAEYVIKNLPEGTDIIHDHTHISVLAKRNLNIPTVCTIHGTINYTIKHPVFVSKRALQIIGHNHGFYVYNGLNLEEFEFSEEKKGYLLYLGRLDKIKGLNHALDVAESTGKKLIIAGPVHDKAYYSKEVEPRIKNNPNIEYIGSVGGRKKQEVLKYASCLLFPTSWEEPFGLVMIEAMACGTPVLALPNGAVPEVLKDFPEFICDNTGQMADKVLNMTFPSAKTLRNYAINNYNSDIMAQGYVQVYEKVWNENNTENGAEDKKPELISKEKDKVSKEENKIKIEENKIKIEENKIKLEENKVKIEENKVKIEENKANIEENKVNLKENKVSIEENKINQNKNQFLPEINIIKKSKKLRILQVAPNAFPCPPKDYGGIERVVYDLTEELVKLGHEVILYAAEGSKSSAILKTYEIKESNSNYIVDFVSKTIPANVDIIHDHTHACVMNQSKLTIPMVNTIHDSRKNTAPNPVYLCKKALKNAGADQGFYAYNGINPDDYEFCINKENYLIFMGILYSHKGINYALDVAERTGQKLIIAGPIYDMKYYKSEIEPRIKQNPNIVYVGSVGGAYRQSLLKKSRCMIFPTVWEEPFGLVMIEAMACGTPVIAFGNGAVPEVMADFPELICSNVDEMIHKVLNQELPKAQILRDYVADNFSAYKMALRYLDIYGKILNQKSY